MKSKVDKYDVFQQQKIKSLKCLPKFIYRMMMIKLLKRKLNLVEKDGLNNPANVLKFKELEEKYDLQMANFVIDAGSIFKSLAHSIYETNKDIENIDMKTLRSFLSHNEITLNSFLYHFDSQSKDAIYYLALYAILEKNGIPVEIQNPKGIFQIIYLFNKNIYSNTAMTDEDLALLEKIIRPDFKISDLTPAEKEFIDSYHEKYMEEIVKMYTTTEEVSNDKVLKNAYKIYKRN